MKNLLVKIQNIGKVREEKRRLLSAIKECVKKNKNKNLGNLDRLCTLSKNPQRAPRLLIDCDSCLYLHAHCRWAAVSATDTCRSYACYRYQPVGE